MSNAYLRPANIDDSVKRLRNFLHTQKQNGNQQIRSNVGKSFAARERLRFNILCMLQHFLLFLGGGGRFFPGHAVCN